MKLGELLADIELVIQFFAGLDPNHEVRIAQQPGAVDVVVEPTKAVEAEESAHDEQKEGE